MFTIGHSTHSLDELFALLRMHGVVSLADVRRHPGSRRLPWFSSESLAQSWPGYAHLPELGGRRPRRKDSPNGGWEVAAFAGYADHMTTSEFEAGLGRLLALEAPAAVMCAEGNWWQCHRRLVSDALVVRGHEVQHIARDGKLTAHELTAFAILEPGDLPRLTYPPAQLELGSWRGLDPLPAIADARPMTDTELKSRHAKMWASGDYPLMVDTFLIPIGERLAEALPIEEGARVLDVAAGTGNASIPVAARGARVTASDLTPELLEAGSRRPDAEGLDIEWVTADAESLPFEDGSFDVVMSSIGVMFAPHHERSSAEMVRVCRPGGTIGLLSWTPEGMIGELFKEMKPFAPPPPPGAQSPPLWGSPDHLRGLFGDQVDFHTVERDVLEITAFARPRDWGEHFKAYYGPTIAARANAERDGRAEEFDAVLDAFCDRWNRGDGDRARFEQEYILTVGTRAAAS